MIACICLYLHGQKKQKYKMSRMTFFNSLYLEEFHKLSFYTSLTFCYWYCQSNNRNSDLFWNIFSKIMRIPLFLSLWPWDKSITSVASNVSTISKLRLKTKKNDSCIHIIHLKTLFIEIQLKFLSDLYCFCIACCVSYPQMSLFVRLQ